MSDETKGGCLLAITIIGTIAVSISSGVLAWNWIHPKSFGGTLIFLAAWSLLSYIGYFIIAAIAAIFSSN